jgi:uncharacterized protein (DUF2235 family)
MKNIVICCDGTSNEISENISSVLKLYRCARKTHRTQPFQAVYYHPGIGTLARPDPWRKLTQDFVALLGIVTGYGLDDHVLSTYEFIVRNYEDGDRIYLFGFSRGAYTVRVLAGLIHKVGLIWPQQVHLAGAGLTAYKQFSGNGRHDEPQPDASIETCDDEGPLPVNRYDQAAQFARILSARRPTIHFVGVFDTVASVVVPRPDRLYLPSREELAFTIENPSVNIFRQAISIDERRRMFRLKKWNEPETFVPDRFNEGGVEPQDIKQVWFAGAHGDLGTGDPIPEKESALSKYPLLWMIDEATRCGLSVDQQMVNELAWGVQRKGSPFSYAAPCVRGKLHNQMTLGWRLLEYIPKPDKYKEWPKRRSHFGFYIPDAEPRLIPKGAFIHESVVRRMDALADYRPVNLPSKFETVPMPVKPEPG